MDLELSVSKQKKRILILFLVLTAISSFSGCNTESLPDLSGRYQGREIRTSGINQIVAQIPDFVDVAKSKVLTFQIYKTLGTAQGVELKISVLNQKTIIVASPLLSNTPVQLTKNGNCATQANALESIKLCWDTGMFDLDVISKGVELYSLHLTRDDSLPEFDDQVGQGRTYSLDELVGRARFLNYSVSQEAERVFQAKENIGVARGNLLPKLSLRGVVGVFTADYLSVVGNALPFLFPSNWFKWKASQNLFQAERKSFASLRGNQMNAVEGLYYLILRDQAVLAELDQQITWMNRTKTALAQEELGGTLPTGSADYFGTSIAPLARDRLDLNSLIQNEYGELAQSVALPPLNGIFQLSASVPPSLDGVKPIRAEDFFRDAQVKSYEISALGFLLKAARNLTTDVFFEFLDPEAGGSIGFGTANSFRVSKSQESELKKREDEIYSLIEQKAAQVANENNTALENYSIAQSGLSSTQKRLTWLMQRHLNGDSTLDETDFINQLVDLEIKTIGFSADKVSSIATWQMSQAKLERLLLQGFYGNLEEDLPTEENQSSGENSK